MYMCMSKLTPCTIITSFIHVYLAAAACVSCQELTSTLSEGNSTCPGEEVTFTCTLTGSLGLGWISPGYINNDNPLQFSTASTLGVDVPSMIDGRTTATATLTTNTMENGVRVLESTLRITATVASTVICSGTIGDSASIEFSISGTLCTYMYNVNVQCRSQAILTLQLTWVERVLAMLVSIRE